MEEEASDIDKATQLLLSDLAVTGNPGLELQASLLNNADKFNSQSTQHFISLIFDAIH